MFLKHIYQRKLDFYSTLFIIKRVPLQLDELLIIYLVIMSQSKKKVNKKASRRRRRQEQRVQLSFDDDFNYFNDVSVKNNVGRKFCFSLASIPNVLGGVLFRLI